MRVYIYTIGNDKLVIVQEHREDLARQIAEEHCGHADLQLIEEFDGRDREIIYSNVQ